MRNRVATYSRLLLSISVVLIFCVYDTGCGWKMPGEPEITITRVPDANAGGPEKLGYIEGTVSNAKPGQHVVLYAHSGIWWVQPFADRTATAVLPDGGWKNSTHLGTEYAALLVDSGYTPVARTGTLPVPGHGVLAVAKATGKPAAPVVAKTLHFSGYEWIVRSLGSDRGGEPNAYDPSNAWTDERGYLHLRTAQKEGHWTCAEVSLARSLGYGTYRIVVEDSAHLPPSAVVGFLTYDDVRTQDFGNEIDIELSRWGDPKRKNAQYVVQPFYVPENVFRFESPAARVTHSFRWEPGRVTFQTARGSVQGGMAHPEFAHVFSSGIPTPSGETIRINLYDFRHAQHPSQPPAEVVIEKFEYLP